MKIVSTGPLPYHISKSGKRGDLPLDRTGNSVLVFSDTTLVRWKDRYSLVWRGEDRRLMLQLAISYVVGVQPSFSTKPLGCSRSLFT